MRETLVIREHNEREYDLSQDQVAVLEADFSKEVQLTPMRDPKRFLIRVSSSVGFIQLPGDLTLAIRSKIPAESILYLLMLVYDPDKKIFRPEEQHFSTFEGIFEFVVQEFVRHVEDLIAGGILRNYQQKEDDLIMIRGKLQITETLRRHPAVRDRHWCQYSRLTPDICENKIIKSTILQLKNYSYQRLDLRSRIRRLERAFIDVAQEIDSLDLFDDLEYHRLNDHYRPALGLARILLENITFSGSVGSESFLSFLINMDWLFEKVIETYLKRWKHAELKVVGQRKESLDHGSQVKVKPDVTLLRGRSPVFAVDAKYKLDPDQKDIYQILAYCHALGIGEAALAYPMSENMPQGKLFIREPGNVGISYVPIDLSGAPQEIEANAEIFINRISQLIPYETIASVE